jgi:hypothetical protein
VIPPRDYNNAWGPRANPEPDWEPVRGSMPWCAVADCLFQVGWAHIGPAYFCPIHLDEDAKGSA